MGRCLSKLGHGKRRFYVEDNPDYLTPVQIVRYEIPTPQEGPAGAGLTDSHPRDDNTVPKVAGPSPCPGPQRGSLSARVFANRRLLDNINVDSVLDYLHFIDDQNLRSNRTASQRTQVDLLLEAISKSKEIGKWDKFIKALRKSEHPFVADQLTRQETEHHDHLKAILRKVTSKIIDRADVSGMIDILFEQNVLNDEDMETIRREQRYNNEKSACRVMLNMIPRRAHDWYGILKETLRRSKMPDIADAMKEYEIEEAMNESLREFQEAEEPYDVNTATDQGDKPFEKENFRVKYTEPHPDVEKLQAIRTELRNVIHNMKHKYHIPEMEMRLVEELKQILEEIPSASNSRADESITNAERDRNSGTPTSTRNDTNNGIEDPDVRLSVDTSSSDLPNITQVVVKKAASVQVKLNDEDVQGILSDIQDKYQALEKWAVRHNQSLSDLTKILTPRGDDGRGQSDSGPPYSDLTCIAADSDDDYVTYI